MGDVVSINAFRDRRKQPVSGPAEVSGFANKNEVHEHLRTLHGWGGPKSTSRADLDRIHDDRHHEPLSWETPHRHV